MRKDLTIALMLVLTLSLLIQATSVGAVTIPNADHIYAVTIGTPETVDPAWAYDTASGEIIQNIYEPLCMFNGTSTGEYLSAVADWWPGIGVGGNGIVPIKPGWNGSAETWLFRIRGYGDSPNPKISWQNASYGFVTPADVEYSFERGMYMDHTNGPQWMFYEPLFGGASSYDYDLDGDGDLNATEWAVLDVAVNNAVQQNGTHVWFNLASGYAPFQQILSQTWSVVMCKQWSIDQGLWNGVHTYAEFKRTWDPDPPGPLMNPAKAMGSGPYKLEFMNEDPDTGYYTLLKFDGYWRGWGAKFVTRVTTKSVSEWANRKAQFFSTDPALQADFAVIPRANVPELHEDGDKDHPALPGIRLYIPSWPSQTLDAFYYTYEIAADSPYVPLVGTTPNRFLLKDRNMRLVMNYLVNFTQYINDVFLGEATQSPMCMPKGTLYWNGSKPMYDINLAKAQAYLDVATGWTGAAGSVKAAGITMKLVYNTGNTARETFCKIVADGLLKLTWGPSAVVNIQALGIPWATYLPQLRAKQLPVFSIGWMADFPDPHNWFYPFMSSTGTYSSRQVVTYGLDPSTMNWEDTSYGPPPYINALGESVTEINGTYIDHLISTGVQIPNTDPRREKLYNELFDIYHAEASQLPTVSALPRHYERTWIHGWIGTFNENPIAPGRYYYTMWKEPVGTVKSVDVAASDIAMSPTNNITTYLLSQGYHAPGTPVAWMKLNPASEATSPIVSITASVTSYNATGPDVIVYVMWVGRTASGYMEQFGFAYKFAPAGTTITMGPENVSNLMPAVGKYDLWVYCFVLDDYAFNVNVTKDFYGGSFTALGYGDVGTAAYVADNKVTISDIVITIGAFGSLENAPKWRWSCDVNCDHKVTIADVVIVIGQFGTLYTTH
jgi:peptide/nickel transport system substrate-binding protein